MKMFTVTIVYGFLLGISLKQATANSNNEGNYGKYIVHAWYIMNYLQGTTIIQ